MYLTNHGKVQIQVGNSKMFFRLDQLEKSNPIKEEVIAKHPSSSILKTQSVSSEINIIGCTVEEARIIIDKYIDDCYLAGLDTIRIIHGKGTGTLRTGVQSFLKNNPRVKSFRYGTYGEGEMGVTIVQLV